MMRITAFVDCDSESIVIRMPYDMAVDMICVLPDTPDKKELQERVGRASSRSRKLRHLLDTSNCFKKGMKKANDII